MRENGKECYLIRGRESNFSIGLKYFPREPTQNLSLQNGKKTGWREFDSEMTKLHMCNAHRQSSDGFFFNGFLGMNIASPFFFFLLIS